MISVPNDAHQIDSQDTYTSLKNCAAAQRALDHYLKPEVSGEETSDKLFQVRSDIGMEEAVIHAYDLLRCAAAVAYQLTESLQGASRDLAFSAIHMIDLARAMVERSLNQTTLTDQD